MLFIMGAIFGLIIGIGSWCLIMIATIERRNELKSAAKIEYEEIHSQEGFDSISFMRRDGRHPMIRDEKLSKRELNSTEAGEQLRRINHRILNVSIAISILATIVIIVVELIKKTWMG